VAHLEYEAGPETGLRQCIESRLFVGTLLARRRCPINERVFLFLRSASSSSLSQQASTRASSTRDPGDGATDRTASSRGPRVPLGTVHCQTDQADNSLPNGQIPPKFHDRRRLSAGFSCCRIAESRTSASAATAAPNPIRSKRGSSRVPLYLELQKPEPR
jgi:hypothetical protein